MGRLRHVTNRFYGWHSKTLATHSTPLNRVHITPLICRIATFIKHTEYNTRNYV